MDQIISAAAPTSELMRVAKQKARAVREASAVPPQPPATLSAAATAMLAKLVGKQKSGVHLECPLCGHVKTTTLGMKYHLKQRVCLKKTERKENPHLGTVEKPRPAEAVALLCPLCAQPFSWQAALRSHLDTLGRCPKRTVIRQEPGDSNDKMRKRAAARDSVSNNSDDDIRFADLPATLTQRGSHRFDSDSNDDDTDDDDDAGGRHGYDTLHKALIRRALSSTQTASLEASVDAFLEAAGCRGNDYSRGTYGDSATMLQWVRRRQPLCNYGFAVPQGTPLGAAIEALLGASVSSCYCGSHDMALEVRASVQHSTAANVVEREPLSPAVCAEAAALATDGAERRLCSLASESIAASMSLPPAKTPWKTAYAACGSGPVTGLDVTLETDDVQAVTGVSAWVAAACQPSSSSSTSWSSGADGAALVTLWQVALGDATAGPASPHIVPAAVLLLLGASQHRRWPHAPPRDPSDIAPPLRASNPFITADTDDVCDGSGTETSSETVVDLEWNPSLDPAETSLGVLAVATESDVRVYNVPRPPSQDGSATAAAAQKAMAMLMLQPALVVRDFPCRGTPLCVKWNTGGSCERGALSVWRPPRLLVGTTTGAAVVVDVVDASRDPAKIVPDAVVRLPSRIFEGQKVKSRSAARTVAWSPVDDGVFAVGYDDGSFRVWDDASDDGVARLLVESPTPAPAPAASESTGLSIAAVEWTATGTALIILRRGAHGVTLTEELLLQTPASHRGASSVGDVLVAGDARDGEGNWNSGLALAVLPVPDAQSPTLPNSLISWSLPDGAFFIAPMLQQRERDTILKSRAPNSAGVNEACNIEIAHEARVRRMQAAGLDFTHAPPGGTSTESSRKRRSVLSVKAIDVAIERLAADDSPLLRQLQLSVVPPNGMDWRAVSYMLTPPAVALDKIAFTRSSSENTALPTKCVLSHGVTTRVRLAYLDYALNTAVMGTEAARSSTNAPALSNPRPLTLIVSGTDDGIISARFVDLLSEFEAKDWGARAVVAVARQQLNLS